MDYDKLNTFLILFGIVSIISTIIWAKIKIRLKETEDEKAEHKKILFNLCLKAAQVGIWQYNIKNDVLLWSEEMIELFGQNVNNLEGFLKCVHKDDREKIKSACLETIDKNIPYKQIYKIVLPNGVVKTISVRGEVYKDKFLGVATDIIETERIKLELLKKTEDLEEINEELTKFAYITSHDLKAPLRALANLSEWVLQEVAKISEPTPELKKYIGLMQNRTQRMEGLINGILEYSRVGRFNTEREVVDLNKLISEVIDVNKKEGFEVTHDLLPIILINKVRKFQVFSNLINNSIKHHNKKTGKIHIGYKELNDSHLFTVADDGPGIDKKYHKKIFEMFQTLGSKEDTDSTGIGLTLVKKIIEDAGGEVGINSSPGQGCEIWFTIPKVLE